MQPLSFKIADFEGPLDLLLHLISKHKMDIYDIQIVALVEQYLEYLRSAQIQDMDIASEFLEMASRLVYIKSVSLLPKYEEDAQELKQELTGQLLEYQACKEAAARLAQQNHLGDIFVRRPATIEVDMAYRRHHEPQQLLRAYILAAGKSQRRLPPPQEAFTGIVNRRFVSVKSKIISVLRKLYKKERVPFQSLFTQAQDRSELVATFLAVLELVKNKRITVSENSKQVSLCQQNKQL